MQVKESFESFLITKAGLIPYVIEDGQLKMLFMVSSDPQFGGPDPMISKGNVEDCETPYDCAIREAVEELGLRTSNIKTEPFVLADVSLKGLCDEYFLRVFACEVHLHDAFDTPHYETAYTEWMTASEFDLRGRPSHKELVNNLVATLLEGVA